jgi:hypothetical protein
LSPDSARSLAARAAVAGVDRSTYIALLIASEGSPEYRLKALGEVSRATLAVSEIADGLRRMQGEVLRANGSVRSLFIDAYAAAKTSKPELDAAAHALLRAADRIDDYLRALEPDVRVTLSTLKEMVKALRA